MIRLTGVFNPSFRIEIDKFCFHNEISICYRTSLGNVDMYTFSGEHDSIDKLIEYNKKLETELKRKSLWYRLLN